MFRTKELFPFPRLSAEGIIKIFCLFPEAEKMLSTWAIDNLEILTASTAHQQQSYHFAKKM